MEIDMLRIFALSTALFTSTNLLAAVPATCQFSLIETAISAITQDSSEEAAKWLLFSLETITFDYRTKNPTLVIEGIGKNNAECTTKVVMQEPEFVFGCPDYEVKVIETDCK